MGRTKKSVGEFREAKNAAHEAKTHGLASLELRAPVRDVHGNKVERFFEGQAHWSLKLHRVVSEEHGRQHVPIPEAERKVLADLSGRVPTTREVDVVRHVPVYEMCWEVVQVDGNGNAVVITIPYADAYVREARRVLELEGTVTVDIDGQSITVGVAGEKTTQLLPPAVAKPVREELARRAKVAFDKKVDELEERMEREHIAAHAASAGEPVDIIEKGPSMAPTVGTLDTGHIAVVEPEDG